MENSTPQPLEKRPEPLEKTSYELSQPGRQGIRLPDPDVPLTDIPADLCRTDLDFPEMGELDVVRHFIKLSQFNYSIDKGFYPLGSCTMKYNPKINEDMARLPGFAHVHPLQSQGTTQGALALMYRLQEWLCEISGFDAVSIQPAAGAHGEFAGILMIRKYHLDRGDAKRTKILVPDSAHGTNPATTSMAGLQAIELPSDKSGDVDLDVLRKACEQHKEELAGMMITVPSTLGVFEEHIVEIIKIVHEAGGLMYMDGANMNALLGVAKPGELGFDVMHYNLHKTFSTPHGGGGPGADRDDECHPAGSGGSLGRLGAGVADAYHGQETRVAAQSGGIAAQRCLRGHPGPAHDLGAAFLSRLFPACPQRTPAGVGRARGAADHGRAVLGPGRGRPGDPAGAGMTGTV
ncbi:MAG: hypothetical protein F9K46_04655, partial [Anaerolineae bacterium]